MTRREDQNRAHDARRRAQKPWRKWYSTTRWRRLRRAQLRRQPYCVICRAQGKSRFATVADHVKAHRGDPHLFWFGELRSVCEEHHNRDSQIKDTKGYDLTIGEDGFPMDPNHPFNIDRKGIKP
ncbi:hypothetical protein TVVG_00035 [Tetraselmis viridis virus SI1]|uniref:HNH endonuclease n=1 Tax=Tetraselmis viridis virus S20 TaxID=754070 RepID=UPI0002C0D885|nr:HNH endonuclease [Tetraselmis viridis virus S20]AGH31329.1 hypothetical protein TVGG_00001 [Tetraselmis viridis virus S20]AGH31418.1 hypothetical protein TVVG_00035 [Tetraselmis viridis virus SI1]